MLLTSRLSLTGKMIAYFMIVVSVGLAGFVYVSLQAITAGDLVEQTKEEDIPRLLQTAEVARNAENQVASLRGFLISGDSISLDNFRRVVKENEKLEADLLKAARTEQGKKLITDLMALEKKYVEIAERTVIPLKLSGKDAEAIHILNGEMTQISRTIRNVAKEYTELRRKQIDASMAKSMKAVDQSELTAKVASIACAVLGIAIGIFAARRITKPIKELQDLMAKAGEGNLTVRGTVTSQDEIGQLVQSFNQMTERQRSIVTMVRQSAQELAAASEQLAASSEQVSSTSTEIAKSIQTVARENESCNSSILETSKVLVQLSSLIQIAQNQANETDADAKEMNHATTLGRGTVDQAMTCMANIKEKTLDTEKHIQELSTYSNQIGLITETITQIAKQTNLLALNAAIEAARAGEAGRGFAVVAEEVRKLAEQSNQGAAGVAELVRKVASGTEVTVAATRKSCDEVERGVTAVSQVGDALQKIAAAIERTVNHANAIANVTNDEVASSDQIVKLINNLASAIETAAASSQQVSAAAQETTATMQTVAASAEEMSAMANDLRNAVAVFKVA